MSYYAKLLYVILLIAIVTGCGTNKEQSVVELTISAAASLTNALEEIQTTFERDHTYIKLNFNFGASGALQQQIEQGAPSDVFFSAAMENLEELVDKQLIRESKYKNILINELVVVVPTNSKLDIQQIEDLTKDNIQHLAVGIPETVPAGSYAKEALTHSRLWDTLQPRMVQAKDVRQVLTYVESGNAEAGFVYKTDALSSEDVVIAFSVDPTAYTAVRYPVGIVKATKHYEEALDFYEYLQSKEAKDVFVKYGFSIVEQ